MNESMVEPLRPLRPFEEYDELFLELRTAKEWRLTPREWRAESEDDRALMMAFEFFTNTREAYRQEWQEQKRNKDEKGPNPFEAMKRQMGL